MSTTFHTPVLVGDSNSPSTLNSRFASLDTAITAMSGAGGVFVKANGAASAGQKIVTVTSSTGLVAGAPVVYTLDGGEIEANTVATVDSATQITLTTNIGTGGIPSGGIIAQESPSEAAAKGNYATLAARAAGIDKLPGAMRMGAAVSASATAITLRTAPDTLGTNKGWVAIDPFTTECEIRKVASISGETITIHDGLEYSHSADDAVLWMPVLKMSIELFGALGDFVTDDTAAIQRASDVASTLVTSAEVSPAAATGMVIECGPGQFMMSDGVIFKSRVTFRGSGNSTVFRALSGFPADTAMFEIGDSTDSANAFDARLENLVVDGENYADIGVYSARANELSGITMVQVRDCMDYGIKFEGGQCINWTMRDVYVLMRDCNSTAVGIYIDTGLGTSRGMDSITSICNFDAKIAANIQIENCSGIFLSRIHTETAEDGILIGDVGICSGVHITGFLPAGNTNGVRISDNFSNTGILLNSLHKPDNTTNLLNDESRGYLHTGTSIGFYLVGDLIATRGNRWVLDGWNYDAVPASLTSTIMSRFKQTGVIQTHRCTQSGSVTLLQLASSQSVTAGTCTVTLYKNGNPLALTATLDTTNTTHAVTEVAQRTYTFVAGDSLTLRLSSDSSFLPETANVTALMELET